MFDLLRFLYFLLFLGGLGLLLLEVKGLAVKLIDFEVIELCNETVGCYFEQLGCIFLIVLQIPAEVSEEVGTLLHEACHFPDDVF